jgi:hypothetical protein
MHTRARTHTPRRFNCEGSHAKPTCLCIPGKFHLCFVSVRAKGKSAVKAISRHLFLQLCIEPI